MPCIFTEHVRVLEPGRPVDEDGLSTVWKELSRCLAREMRKRSLWNAPPTYLGVDGGSSWSEPGLFDELVGECHTFVFLERLPALKAQLEVKGQIGGLVCRNVRNFLYERQKKHDPVGYRVYEVLQRAVAELVAAGSLAIEDGDPRVRNGTVLAFGSGGRGSASLEEEVGDWAAALLPDLIRARGRQLDAVVSRARDLVARLRSRGVGRFRFDELAGAVKHEVRTAWAAIGAHSGGETASERGAEGTLRRVRVVRPEPLVETLGAVGELSASVARRLESSSESPRTRTTLWQLWSFLCDGVLESGGEPIPSRRQIARQLGVSRDHLNRLFELLQCWIVEQATGALC